VPTPIDPKRLPALKTALSEYKPDDWTPQRQLAALYGVAPSRFVTLIKTRFQDFPAFERRGDKTNWYPARAAIAAMIAYMEGSSAQKKAAATRHSAVMGRVATVQAEQAKTVASQSPEQLPLSAGELDRLASAQTRIWKLKREQGLFVPRDDVVDLARRYHSTVSREIMNIPQRLDPNGMMAAADRAQLMRITRDITLELYEIMGGLLADADERSDGTVGAGTRTGSDNARRGTRRRESDISRAA
jgi:hypothetical protein